MIRPGPRRLRMPRSEVGGVSIVTAGAFVAALEGGFAWDMRGERCEEGSETSSTVTDRRFQC